MYLKSKTLLPYRRLTILFSSLASLIFKNSMPKIYLMKSEPHVFSITDLQNSESQTSPWDGVRNFEARKTMKLMKAGDLALMYHSNAKKETGIVGLMEIVREAYPDVTCTDPSHEGYDPKADSDDKWVCVDCKLVEIFKRPIYLEEMKSHQELSEMETFKRARLSISHVSKSEFDFICNLAHNTEAPATTPTKKRKKSEEKTDGGAKNKSSKTI